MRSSQLLRMLCGYYAISEEQLVFWLHQKASHHDDALSIQVKKDTYIDESIIFMILNDVIISLIAEGNND